MAKYQGSFRRGSYLAISDRHRILRYPRSTKKKDAYLGVASKSPTWQFIMNKSSSRPRIVPSIPKIFLGAASIFDWKGKRRGKRKRTVKTPSPPCSETGKYTRQVTRRGRCSYGMESGRWGCWARGGRRGTFGDRPNVVRRGALTCGGPLGAGSV